MTTSTEREEARKREQGYDPDIARCGNCLYFTMGTEQERALARKRGYGFSALQRCTFGDFNTTPVGICDEWRNRAGERLQTTDEEAEPCAE